MINIIMLAFVVSGIVISASSTTPAATNNSIPNKSIQPPVGGDYCCDSWGYRRCVLANSPQPVGSLCICEGLGYGIVCR